MSSAFKQTTTTDIISNGFTFGVYLWSTAANWTNGVPGNGAAVTTDHDVAGECFSVGEPRDDLFAVLLQSLKTVVEKDAVGVVTKDGGGECRMKIGAMNLVKGSAESLEVVWSGPSGSDYSAGLEVAHEISIRGSSFPRYPFANSEKVERVHRIR